MKKYIFLTLLLGVFNINTYAQSFELSIGAGNESETSDSLVNVGYTEIYLSYTLQDSNSIEYDRKRSSLNYVYSF